jgi:hypothetical protein
MSNGAALDRSERETYVSPAYDTSNAHPAKAGAAKLRVLASSATPESRRHEGPQDRRAA